MHASAHRRRGFFVLFLLVSVPVTSHAGAWLQPKGHGQLITTLLNYRVDSFYDANGESLSRDPFSKEELNPYLEYGMTDWMTLGGNLLVDHASSSVSPLRLREDYYAVDLELFARFPLWRDPSRVVSIQPLVKMPTMYINDDFDLTRTSGSNDGELALLYGESFTWFGIRQFADTSIGYRLRSGAPRNQWKIAATYGFHFGEDTTLLIQNFTTIAKDIPNGASPNLRTEDDYDLSKIQVSVVYDLTDEWSLQVGGFQHTEARNTGADGGVFTAIWRNF